MRYTTEQLARGDGLYTDRPTKCVSYDDGRTWLTCEAADGVRGEPLTVYVPKGGTWEDRVG